MSLLRFRRVELDLYNSVPSTEKINQLHLQKSPQKLYNFGETNCSGTKHICLCSLFRPCYTRKFPCGL